MFLGLVVVAALLLEPLTGGRLTESSKANICLSSRLLKSLGIGTPLSFRVPAASSLVYSSDSCMMKV